MLLTWDANPAAENVLGYKVWQATLTGPFSLVANVTGTTTTLTLTNSATVRFYVTAYNSAGDGPASNTITYTPPITPPTSGLTFEAESGAITAPFYVNGTMVQQDAQTGVADGGRAAYKFTLTNAASCTVDVFLNAPTESANSLFVNVDDEPTDPAMIWDVPVTSGFQTRTAAWRGGGTFDSPEFPVKRWALAAGVHTLVIRGREAGVQLDRISIQAVTAPPTPQPPSAPTNLRLQQLQGNRRDLGWNAEVTASAVVEKAIESDPFAQVAVVPAGTMHWVDTRARNKTTRYRVKSCRSGLLCSGWSEIVYRP